MKLVKTLVAAAALTASSFAVQATQMTVGGVSWNPESNLDFTAETSQSFFQNFASNTGLLSGWGRITSVQGNTGFCNLCELVFKFEDVGLSSGIIDLPIDPSPFGDLSGKLRPLETAADFVKKGFVFQPGMVQIFVQSAGTFNGSLASINTAQNWLNMDLTNLVSSIIFGKNDKTFSSPIFGTSSGNLLAKSDSAMASQFFANSPNASQSYLTASFGSRFTGPYSAGANLNIVADTVAGVPEPTTIAVLGLGLLGLAGVSRRKQVK